MMIRPLLTLMVVSLATWLPVHAQTFDVAQPAYTTFADYGGSGQWGQTFVATQTGPLVGIRLVATGAKWPGDHPYGSGFIVRLHRVEEGVIQNPPLASGSVTRDRLLLDMPVIVDVYFEIPHAQTAGEHLAFTVLETSGGGANGWNNYALSNANPYPDGTSFTTYSDAQPIETRAQDLAFSTIVAPPSLEEQTLRITRRETGEFVITLPHSVTGEYYRIEESTDLDDWFPVETKPGLNGPLSWIRTPLPEPTAIFYRVSKF